MIDRIKNLNLLKNFNCYNKKKIDDKIVNIAKKKKVLIFRGSEKNVLNRILPATKDKHENCIIQLTADNPFIDPLVIDYVVNFFHIKLSKI